MTRRDIPQREPSERRTMNSWRSSGVVIVANRLPVDRVELADGSPGWRGSPGGLVTGVEPVMRANDGTWIGWPGGTESDLEPFDHDGMHLVPMVTSGQRFTWDETPWEWGKGYGRLDDPKFHVVAIDYGVKRNILRLLAANGCKVTVVPATTAAEDIIALKPDGVFLSNGPGDPAQSGKYAVPVIKCLM